MYEYFLTHRWSASPFADWHGVVHSADLQVILFHVSSVNGREVLSRRKFSNATLGIILCTILPSTDFHWQMLA